MSQRKEIMKRKFFLIIIVGVIFFNWLPSVYSELYKYVDDNGVVSYTDDYSKVSKPAQKSMEVIDEAQTYEEDNEAIQDETSSQKKDIIDNGSDKSIDDVRGELDQEKKELEDEFKTLSVEQENLMQANFDDMTDKEKLQYNEKVTKFNSSLKIYTERSEAYKKRAEEFNNRIKGKN